MVRVFQRQVDYTGKQRSGMGLAEGLILSLGQRADNRAKTP